MDNSYIYSFLNKLFHDIKFILYWSFLFISLLFLGQVCFLRALSNNSNESLYWLDLNFNLLNLTIDINECLTNTNKCDTNADCKNSMGSFWCVCYKGYSGNGTTCQGKNQLNRSWKKNILNGLLRERTFLTVYDSTQLPLVLS